MTEKPSYQELVKRVRELETTNTEIKKELNEARSLSEEIMTYMSEGFIQTDTNASIMFINKSLSEMLGYLPEEIIGKDWLDFVPAEQQSIAKKAEARRSQGLTDRYEIVLKRKTGEKVPVLIGAGPRFEKKDGKYVGSMGVVTDISDRRRMEEALRESEEKHRILFEHTGEALFVAQDGRIVFQNPKSIELSGYSAEEFQSKPFFNFIHDDDREMVRNYHIGRLNNEKLPNRYAFRIIHKNSSILWVELNAVLIQWNGKPAVLCFMTDITERKKAEVEKQELQAKFLQSQKMESIGTLAGGVAHDFNNMIGVIQGHTELALLQTDEDDNVYSDLKEIQTAAMRSADITKQLLAFARKQTISPRSLDLNETVENMLNMLRRLIGEDIELVWKPSAHLWPLKMDPTQIDQILFNLCANARDAISGVGKLIIQTENITVDEAFCKDHPYFTPGDFVMLTLSDDGCGMDEETRNNIFEPFFTTKKVGKGTGLGLATIYGVVKQNNGFIDVYSEPNQGSTFKIYLPRQVEDTDADGTVSRKKSADDGNETVLLVDDDPSLLRMTRMLLEKKGYIVLSAATPSEALEKARQHSGAIDLLMTDVVMPKMNGRELASQITAHYPGIRLLFMSGYTADVISHQGVLDDGVSFIQKPFSLTDLASKVRETLDTPLDEAQP